MSRILPLAGGRVLSTDLPAFVMGILNITGDSFWEEPCSFRRRGR